ncbi:ribonuclease H-like domain-containing protein [Tanacetum coccineum]
MDLESAQNNAIAKLPLLKHENGNSFKTVARTTTNANGTSTSTIQGPVTTEEKAQKKNDVKARSMLLMVLPNEHLLTFNQYSDAKTLFAAIHARLGGNDATKKTQKTLLKQMYENFSASSTESLDSIFNRLQKIVSQLAILGENISQEDLNLKFLRSLPSEWNTHVVVWRNKPDIKTISFDDLYNNFKIVKQEVKGTVTSSSNINSQNMAFVSIPGSTNEVNTANVQVSTANTSVSTAGTTNSTANLSDGTIYAFMANHLNGSHLVHKDLEQIHEDDLEEIDLKWQLALLSIRAKRYYQRTGKKIAINGSDTAGYDKSKVECFNCHKMGHFARECRTMIAIDGASFDWSFMAEEEVSTNIAFMAFSDSEPEFKGYGFKANESVYENSSTKIKKNPDASTIEEWVSDYDEDESEEMVLKSDKVQHKLEQANQPRKNRQNPRNNKTNWNEMKTQKFEVGFQFTRKAYFMCGSFNHLIKDCDFHDKRWNFTPTEVLTKSSIVPISAARQSSSKAAAPVSAARPINTTAPKPYVDVAKPRLNAFQNKGNRVTSAIGKQGINVGDPQFDLKDIGIFDSGFSRHMTGNKSYLTDYQDYDGEFVTFAGSSKGGKITRKGKIRTGKLDFKNVFFVKELKFNLFSVSQMCDMKNSVLFTKTECLILSLDFKLPDESQVMLKVPKKNNMYSLKNVVPLKGLTCLFAKATNDESKLWHRRLGHINFKTMNKLVKGNLVRGLPSNIFENDHTCVACQKGKQHKATCKFDGKADEGFLVGYSISSKAFRVFNSRTRKVEENLHVNFLENKPNVAGIGPEWLFDIDSLTNSMNYQPVSAGNRTNGYAGSETNSDAGQAGKEKVPDQEYILLPLLHTSSYVPSSSEEAESSPKDDAGKKATEQPACNEGVNAASSSFGHPDALEDHSKMTNLEDTSMFDNAYDNRDEGVEADYNNLETVLSVSPIPSTRANKDHPKDQIIREEELLQFKLLNVWTLVDLPYGKKAIGTKWVFRNKKDQREIVVRNKARLVAQGYKQEEGVPEFKGYGFKANESVYENSSTKIKKNPDASTIEEWVSDYDEDESEEMVLKSDKVQHKLEQANQPRKNRQNPRNNKTNWNEMKTQKFEVGRNFAPTVVLTKSRIVPISAARKRAVAPISAVRPINIAAPEPFVNVTKTRTNTFHKTHSPIRRPFYKSTTPNTRISNEKVNAVRVNGVNTAGQKAVSAVKGKRDNAVKTSAC